MSARIAAQIATIPPANRDMIVFHNAWLYYNRRFGLRTLGAIEEVPGSEPSAAHIAHLIDLARAAHVRAIFAEPEYNAKLVNAVARSAGIPHVAMLYDDSVGTSPQTRDYISMLDTDTATIVTRAASDRRPDRALPLRLHAARVRHRAAGRRLVFDARNLRRAAQARRSSATAWRTHRSPASSSPTSAD